MTPTPQTIYESFKPADLLKGKKVIVTGGDSGIGRSVAVACAREGADVGIIYLEEHKDAEETKREVERHDRRCVTVAGDVGDESFCKQAVEKIVRELGGVDVLVNNAGEQHLRKNIDEIGAEQLERTFRTNVFSFFYMTKAVLPYLREGSTIINTTSVTAYKGSPA